ncbi:MAG: signal peptidase I [Firmicutes bacterium]|nr:signal peptidase I [Bacillota bacterium]
MFDRFKKEVKESFLYFLQIAIITLVIINFIGRVSVVQGSSMEPKLHTGERIGVNLFIYHFEQPSRGDIIIFKCPADTNKDYIKRVIGISGDKVEIKSGTVYLNNQAIPEPYLTEKDTDNYGPVAVPARQYFVLGDNRRNSEDSRVWGFVDSGLIKGKAFFIFWPLKEFGPIK